jgi:quercetin dioxygenase-like cupin family protein
MKVQASQDVPLLPVTMAGSADCQVRWLVSRSDGAPNFAMRLFEIAPGGYTPHHHHPYEHEIFILSGQGEVLEGETPRPLTSGDVALIQPNEVHQFRNTGNEVLRMLCLIPNEADLRTADQQAECSAVSPTTT